MRGTTLPLRSEAMSSNAFVEREAVFCAAKDGAGVIFRRSGRRLSGSLSAERKQTLGRRWAKEWVGFDELAGFRFRSPRLADAGSENVN